MGTESINDVLLRSGADMPLNEAMNHAALWRSNKLTNANPLDVAVALVNEVERLLWTCTYNDDYIRELSDDLAESQAKVRGLERKMPFAHVENVDSLTVDNG